MVDRIFPLAEMIAFAEWTEGLAEAWDAGSSQGRRGKNTMTTRAEMIRKSIDAYTAKAEENAMLAQENAELKRKCHVLEYGAAPSGFTD